MYGSSYHVGKAWGNRGVYMGYHKDYNDNMKRVDNVSYSAWQQLSALFVLSYHLLTSA